MQRILRLISLISCFFLVLLQGCGQSGPLYPPDQTPPITVAPIDSDEPVGEIVEEAPPVREIPLIEEIPPVEEMPPAQSQTTPPAETTPVEKMPSETTAPKTLSLASSPIRS
jgi:predicted small lipoprotein YifL